MKRMHIMITFTEPILGTANNNENIHREFIASKAPDAISREEEVAALGVEGVEEKSMTVFSRNKDGQPIIWNYQIKGFFKEVCGSLQRSAKGEFYAKESCKIKAYKKVIDCNIEPAGDKCMNRMIPIVIAQNTEIDDFQRPLRAQTAQGERIALANSERISERATAEFYVVTPDAYVGAIYEWLECGYMHGLGQWRNAGHGRFTYEVLEVEDIKSLAQLHGAE